MCTWELFITSQNTLLGSKASKQHFTISHWINTALWMVWELCQTGSSWEVLSNRPAQLRRSQNITIVKFLKKVVADVCSLVTFGNRKWDRKSMLLHPTDKNGMELMSSSRLLICSSAPGVFRKTWKTSSCELLQVGDWLYNVTAHKLRG